MSKSEKFRYLMLVLPVVVVIAAVGIIMAASAGAPIGAKADTPVTAAVYANINITPGSDPTQLCFSWETTSALIPAESTSPIPTVQIARASAMTTTGVFPESRATTFYGQSAEANANAGDATATVFAGWYQNRVTATGLKPNTAYVYRYGNGTETGWSNVYSFNTGNPNSFAFLAVGDPQLGAAEEPTGTPGLAADTMGWQTTMGDATTLFPNASFMLSVGDEVNASTQATQDNEYAAYFSPSQMQDLPVANVCGNHDYYVGSYYGDHYNLPNQSAQYGATQFGNDGDYWFTYGNALFMVLNSNTMDVATHDTFIGQAIAANPNAKWRIVSFHHSLYSEASHVNDADVQWRRLTFPAVFDKYKIDVVISGHDHSYTRTYQMLGGVPQKKQTYYNGSVLHPTGTVYFTLDSGSGSKFYQFTVPEQAYSAFRWQQNVPTFSYVTVNTSGLSIVTYRTDNNQIVDKYSICK